MRARRAIGFSLDISKVFFPFSSLYLMIHLFGGYTVGNGAMKGKEPLGTVGIRGIVEIGWGNFHSVLWFLKYYFCCLHRCK